MTFSPESSRSNRYWILSSSSKRRQTDRQIANEPLQCLPTGVTITITAGAGAAIAATAGTRVRDRAEECPFNRIGSRENISESIYANSPSSSGFSPDFLCVLDPGVRALYLTPFLSIEFPHVFHFPIAVGQTEFVRRRLPRACGR